MSTQESIKNTQNIYDQFLEDWKKIKKIQDVMVNDVLDKIDKCKVEEVLKLIDKIS